MGLRDGTAKASGTYRVLNRSNLRLLSVNAGGTDALTKSSSATTKLRLDARQQPADTVVREWGCEVTNGDQH